MCEVQIDRPRYPTYGQVLADQIKGADAQEIDTSEAEANRHRLYQGDQWALGAVPQCELSRPLAPS